jgi:ABC-type Mn2+/Zn2+ transport system permease subunit
VDYLIEPFRYGFMQTALAAAVLVGLTCAVLGAYVVQRRMAFVGDALAHTTLPGLVIAYLFGWSLSLGALAAGVLAALGIGWVSRRQTVKEDTAIGVVFTGTFALGILLMSRARSFRDLSHMLFGNILGVGGDDLRLMAGVTGVVLLTLLLFHKELELTSFDATHAEVIGIRADRLKYLLLVLLALAVVTGIQAAGVVLTSALLVTPAATASLLTDRFPRMMLIAALVSVASAVIGLYVSYYLQASSGAAIVLTCTAFFALAWLARSLRQRFSPPAEEDFTPARKSLLQDGPPESREQTSREAAWPSSG